MLDIIGLVLIPLALMLIIAVAASVWNNRYYKSNNLNHRILKISNQPRSVADVNHNDFSIVELMNGDGQTIIKNKYDALYREGMKVRSNDTEIV